MPFVPTAFIYIFDIIAGFMVFILAAFSAPLYAVIVVIGWTAGIIYFSRFMVSPHSILHVLVFIVMIIIADVLYIVGWRPF